MPQIAIPQQQTKTAAKQRQKGGRKKKKRKDSSSEEEVIPEPFTESDDQHNIDQIELENDNTTPHALQQQEDSQQNKKGRITSGRGRGTSRGRGRGRGRTTAARSTADQQPVQSILGGNEQAGGMDPEMPLLTITMPRPGGLGAPVFKQAAPALQPQTNPTATTRATTMQTNDNNVKLELGLHAQLRQQQAEVMAVVKEMCPTQIGQEADADQGTPSSIKRVRRPTKRFAEAEDDGKPNSKRRSKPG